MTENEFDDVDDVGPTLGTRADRSTAAAVGLRDRGPCILVDIGYSLSLSMQRKLCNLTVGEVQVRKLP